MRKLDRLGRIVIPKELLEIHDIRIRDPLEIFTDDKRIALRKYRSTDCIFCENYDNNIYFKSYFICASCLKQIRPSEAPGKPVSSRPSSKPTALDRFREAKEKYPDASQKQLAEILGITQGRVSQLNKELK
ncbi:sigma factor-like helix-turn-helix DNA-binding protein [Paenibacillus aurantius]|uniref:Sigma factor-like helix-turn-helix DNA-binding protein n=1 Tax=Paenibacillus aurantius TaxID=2918900 RepID=A0AA96LDC2_9BACL|nr:AbrB/MazE/SpoVT family DNA-binding domain-containing protein [Paenibacillus aurantius]WNQ10085.1 sigma factor-like helix-turn-helix DNA-binding protein [Paenibacillus aurantius]